MTESILQEPNPAQQLLFIALDPTNELVSIADANGRIHYLNKAGEQLFGRKPGERRGFSLQELIGGSDDQMGQIRRGAGRARLLAWQRQGQDERRRLGRADTADEPRPQ